MIAGASSPDFGLRRGHWGRRDVVMSPSPGDRRAVPPDGNIPGKGEFWTRAIIDDGMRYTISECAVNQPLLLVRSMARSGDDFLHSPAGQPRCANASAD